MKKVLLTIAAVFGLSIASWAVSYPGTFTEEVNVPAANQANALMTADYGGVEISTLCFSSGPLLIGATQEYLVYGFNFSSSSLVGNDFAGVSDSTGDVVNGIWPLFSQQNPSFLVYASSASNTVTINNNGMVGTQVWFKYPAILRRGLYWWVSSTRMNCVTLFYKKRK